MFRIGIIAIPALLAASSARAQFSIEWLTIANGGSTTSGGTFSLSATIGQPDAGGTSGGTFDIGSGFWFGAGAPACYANCDASTAAPVLNTNDFQCFLNKFAAGCP